MAWSSFSEDTQTIAGSLSKDTAGLGSVLDENSSEGDPFVGEQFISQELNDIIDQEDAELEHIFCLILDEYCG